MMADPMERFEEAAPTASGGSSSSSSSSLVAGLVQQLSGALVYTDAGNAETNRRLWDRYAEAWAPQAEFITTMAGHTARTAKPSSSSSPPSVLGEEWSSPGDLLDVLERYLWPLLSPEARVAEIGVGGGRVARHTMRRCAQLVCLDLSPRMLAKAEATLRAEQQQQQQQQQEQAGGAAATAALEFVLLDPQAPARYPASLTGSLDVVYSFDVLVHVDLHTMFQVFCSSRRLLKPGGRAFFSTANLLTPAGWRRFERQRKYTAAGFYFVCPAMVDRLLAQAGFRVLRRSAVPEGFKELADAAGPAHGNLYEGRDYLVVCEAVEMVEAEAEAETGGQATRTEGDGVSSG